MSATAAPISIASADNCVAYFQQVHPIYPFLDQEVFENRASHDEGGAHDSSDKAWLALFHAVISLGCMFHDGGSLQPAHGLAWHYFRVALRHLQDLLLSKASLLKAQVSRRVPRVNDCCGQ
jgi:hypothetical protein